MTPAWLRQMKTRFQAIDHWIFDMDGTLTVACHDFDDIRARLGLPQGVAILEALNAYPEAQSRVLHQQLYDYEMALAHQARPQPGARDLLDRLQAYGHQMGILTRNSLEIAHTTLRACGLKRYFRNENILGRECCAPKPDPAGVLQLMRKWGSRGDNTVVVGDYLFDLQSGFSAGAYTIHFDVHGNGGWPEYTHYRISGFSEITGLV